MDSIQVEKLQAMESWKKINDRRSAVYILCLLFQLLITLLFLGLFCSGPIWVPQAATAAARVLSARAAAATAVCFHPKFLFVVCNIIVLLLVGESRLQQSVVVPDAYGEYVQRYTEIQRNSEPEGGENVMDRAINVKPVEVEGEDSNEAGGEDNEKAEDEPDQIRDDDEDDEEDEYVMSTEVLNRKVADFIAKVNQQRRLEARTSGEASSIRIATKSFAANC